MAAGDKENLVGPGRMITVAKNAEKDAKQVSSNRYDMFNSE